MTRSRCSRTVNALLVQAVGTNIRMWFEYAARHNTGRDRDIITPIADVRIFEGRSCDCANRTSRYCRSASTGLQAFGRAAARRRSSGPWYVNSPAVFGVVLGPSSSLLEPDYGQHNDISTTDAYTDPITSPYRRAQRDTLSGGSQNSRGRRTPFFNSRSTRSCIKALVLRDGAQSAFLHLPSPPRPLVLALARHRPFFSHTVFHCSRIALVY